MTALILLDAFRLTAVLAGIFVTYDGIRALFPPPQPPVHRTANAIIRILFGLFGVSAGLPTFLSSRVALFVVDGPLWTAFLLFAWWCASLALVILAGVRARRPRLSFGAFTLFFLASVAVSALERGGF
jgi:hypothetical protein